MAYSWLIYVTVSRDEALRAVQGVYETLGKIVGEDLAEHLDPGEELEPPELGSWPEITVETSAVPSAAEARASLTDPKKTEAAALDRLAKCQATIKIDQPQDFDPAHVSALRALFESLGPAVFTKGDGLELITSESLLTTLAESVDLAAALRAVAAGEVDDEDDDEDDEDEEEDEPATDSARPEMLRKMLAEVAQLPRVRRKVGELLAEAPEIVGSFAERLARVGVEADPAVAKALDVKEREVVQARKALATILRRAEGRR